MCDSSQQLSIKTRSTCARKSNKQFDLDVKVKLAMSTVGPDDFQLIYDNDLNMIYSQFHHLRNTCPVAHTSENGGFCY
jgi:hypothetical protein